MGQSPFWDNIASFLKKKKKKKKKEKEKEKKK